MKILICPGLPRCGTTYLYAQLEKSKLFNNPATKETNYFTHNEPTRPTFLEMYDNHTENKLYLDFSPAYLSDTRSVERIVAFSKISDVKIILHLRHPVDQAFAHYLHDIKAHISRLEYGQNIYYPFFSAPSLRRYLLKRAAAIERLVSAVGRENLFIFNFYQDFRDLASLRERLCEFLGVRGLNLAMEHIGPGGWMPYYVAGGKEGCDIVDGSEILTVPPLHLLLVNGAESMIWSDLTDQQIASLLSASTSWTRQIDRDQFHTLYTQVFRDDFLKTLALLELNENDFNVEPPLTSNPPRLHSKIKQLLSFRTSILDRARQFSRAV